MVGRDLQRLNVDCQWGMHGLRAIADGNVVIIVDVLSFSTAATVPVGRGAIISRLTGNRSAEAEAAAAGFERLRHSIHATLASCPSGRELIEAGYPDDIDIASELDSDRAVPLLAGNAFTLAAL